jgi:hypothetical protein
MAFSIRSGSGAPEGAAARDRRGPRGSRGFSLPVVLILVVGASYGGGRLELNAHYTARRDREEELLFRGAAYVKAIKSFYTAEKEPTRQRLPSGLDELFKDPRVQHRRHIRAVYKDPMTGKEFKVLKRAEGIAGVSSASMEAPLRLVDFGEELGLTEGAKTYSEWIFEAKLDNANTPGGPVGPTPVGPTPMGPTGPTRR